MLATSRTRLVAILAAAVAVVAVAGALDARASTTPPTTTAPLPPGGLFTIPGGGFEVRFAASPTVVTDPDGTSKSYNLGVEEDTESLSVLAPTAYGAAPEATAAERVLLFLDAAGDDIELLANTETRLGPYPAAYFISRITLADGRRVVVYGATVVRANDVSYVFYTDVGGDDSERGRAFVESYAVTIDPYPAPTTTTPTAATTAVATPTTTTTTLPTATTAATTASAAATAASTTVPAGALVSSDGRWLIRFPDGADVSLRASSEHGFAYADYVSVVGDDTLSVRVTELPTAFEWSPAGAAALDAARSGSTVVESTLTSIDGTPGARFTLADADSDTSGDTTEGLLVRSGGQLYRIAYADGGESSPDDAAEFLDSFQLR